VQLGRFRDARLRLNDVLRVSQNGKNVDASKMLADIEGKETSAVRRLKLVRSPSYRPETSRSPSITAVESSGTAFTGEPGHLR